MLRLSLLGPVTIRRASDPPTVSRLAQPRPLALLCYLALATPRGLHSRDSLIALLWPERDQHSGRQALRNALHAIRQALGSELVVTAGDGLVGLDASKLSCDVWALERGVLQRSDAHVAGESFTGFHVSNAHAFGVWLDAMRARIARLWTEHVPDDSASTRAEVRAVPVTTSQRDDVRTLVIRGHYLFLRVVHNGVKTELDEARRNFERALTIDPECAPAIAGLANYYAVAARRGLLTPFETTFARTIALSHRALAIERTLAAPHVHFGVEALYLRDDFDRAGAEFDTAVRLDPFYAEGHRFLGVWRGLAGRTGDAVASMREASRLEPDIPMMLNSYAAALLADGDVCGSERVLCETLTIDPAYGPARERLLRLLEQQARFDDAVLERMRTPALPSAARFEQAWQIDGDEGYRRERAVELDEQILVLETHLVERTAPTVNDLFSPPALRLFAALTERGETKRARTWRLQACSERPALARWFSALPVSRRVP